MRSIKAERQKKLDGNAADPAKIPPTPAKSPPYVPTIYIYISIYILARSRRFWEAFGGYC